MDNIYRQVKHKLRGKTAMSLVVTLVIAVSAISIAYLSYRVRQSLSPVSPEAPLAANGPVACNATFNIGQPPVNPPPPPITCPQRMDIMLVIDRSATMNQTEADGRKKLEWAKDAARGFVESLIASGNTTVRVGVVSFGAQGNDRTGARSAEYDSTLNIPLSANLPSVVTAINGIRHIKPGTCVECGLRIANAQLTSSNRKVVVLISDGLANHSWNGTTAGDDAFNAVNIANTGRARGIQYKTIGYGLKSSNQIDEQLMTAVAGNIMHFQYKPNVADWSRAFTDILRDLCGNTTPPNPTPVVTLYPSADAHVSSGSSSTNYGTRTALQVDGSPTEVAYLKFDFTGLLNKNWTRATLQLKITDLSSGPQILRSSTNTSWLETTLRYSGRPGLASEINRFNSRGRNYWAVIDITNFARANSGRVVTFAVTTSNSDGVQFKSRENATEKPMVVVY